MDHRKVELGPEVYDHATLDEKATGIALGSTRVATKW